FLGVLAGRRLVFTKSETKRIVAEIDSQSGRGSGWFSKVMGLPFPIKYLRKNSGLSTALFIISGVAFASFATFAMFVPGFAAMPLIVMAVQSDGPLPKGFEGPSKDYFDILLQVMKY